MISLGGGGVIRATQMRNEAMAAFLVKSETDTLEERPAAMARRDSLRRWTVQSGT